MLLGATQSPAANEEPKLADDAALVDLARSPVSLVQQRFTGHVEQRRADGPYA
jgi:hypothetical protein